MVSKNRNKKCITVKSFSAQSERKFKLKNNETFCKKIREKKLIGINIQWQYVQMARA